MAIYLKAEFETVVSGNGEGFISISQTDATGEESTVWLSVNQFETIFNHEKSIVKEAFDSPT